MTIRNSSILTGATLAATGGTASTLKTTGTTIPNGVQVCDTGVTDARIRPTLTFKTRPATLRNDGTWQKQKCEMTVVIPKIVASGKVEFPVLRQSIELHPEMTQAEIDKLASWGAQLLFDTDFADYRNNGSTD